MLNEEENLMSVFHVSSRGSPEVEQTASTLCYMVLFCRINTSQAGTSLIK